MNTCSVIFAIKEMKIRGIEVGKDQVAMMKLSQKLGRSGNSSSPKNCTS